MLTTRNHYVVCSASQKKSIRDWHDALRKCFAAELDRRLQLLPQFATHLQTLAANMAMLAKKTRNSTRLDPGCAAMLKLWMRIVGQGLALASVLVSGFLMCRYVVFAGRARRSARRVIHTFHDWDYEDPSAPHAVAETISSWKYNWRRAGWHPRTLQHFECQHSLLYEEMMDALSLALRHGNKKEAACYLRYVAMAAIGGGWLSDSDTVPTHLVPGQDLPNNGIFTVYHGNLSLMSGTQEEFERVSRLLIKRMNSKQQVINTPDCSDRLIFRDMIAQGEILSAERVIPAHFWQDHVSCKSMTDPDHFAVQFSKAAIEMLGYYVDARGPLMNRTMDRWRACRNKTITSI